MIHETLKPCPFCGGKAECEKHWERNIFRVTCNGNQCYIWPRTIWYTSETEAITVWNTRVMFNTLTAERVMAIAAKHQPDYCSDMHACFNWQAIADDLNAELEMNWRSTILERE